MPMDDGFEDVFGQPSDLGEIDQAVEQLAAMHGEATELAAPIGSYSAQSLGEFKGHLEKITKLMGDAEPLSDAPDAVEGPLPADYVARYMAISDAVDAYLAADGDDPNLPPLEALTSDESLSVAGAAMQTLAKDANFKSFLKEMPEEEEVEEEMVEEDVPEEEDLGRGFEEIF